MKNVHPTHILLVENSKDNGLLIQAYLRGIPHKLDTAEDGEIAVEKFKSENYDLILMDILLPVMDGFTATRAIRKWENENARKPASIIAITVLHSRDDIRKSFEAGCNKHIWGVV